MKDISYRDWLVGMAYGSMWDWVTEPEKAARWASMMADKALDERERQHQAAGTI